MGSILPVILSNMYKHLPNKHNQETHGHKGGFEEGQMKVGDKKVLLTKALKEKGLVVQVLKDKVGDEIRYLVTLATREGLKQFAREDSATLYVYKDHATGSVFRSEYFGGRAGKEFGKGKGVENFMREVKTRFDVDFPDYRAVIKYAEGK